jgi:hypothetical protein
MSAPPAFGKDEILHLRISASRATLNLNLAPIKYAYQAYDLTIRVGNEDRCILAIQQTSDCSR